MNKTMTGYPSIDKPWLKYYPKAAIDAVFPGKTAWELIYEKWKNHGNTTAFRYMGRRINYSTFFKAVEACAKSLKALGVRQGDIVTLILPTAPETVYLFYAINRIGAVATALDPRLKAAEYSKRIDDLGSKFIFATDISVSALSAISHFPEKTIVQVSPFESCPAVKLLMSSKSGDSSMSWRQFIRKGEILSDCIDTAFVPGAAAAIVYTGGTTGIPKGVVLTNENFNAMALTQEISSFNLAAGDSFLTFLPPFSAYCLVNAIHDPLYLGFENILIPKFDYADFPKLMVKYKPNHVLAGPILWNHMLGSELTHKADLSFLKSPISGGDVMTPELETEINDFLSAHGCRYHIQQGYGMTEVSAAACYSFENCYCFGSVGIPYVKNVISIFDAETKKELTYDTEGEVCIQSPTMMKEYFHAPEETAAVIQKHSDGSVWLHTGDLGTISSDGNLFIKGRIKRIIVRRGSKVFPSAIEDVIMRHPYIVNCAVVQAPHAEDRHVPVAFLVLKDGFPDNIVDELKDSIREVLPEFNIPYTFFIRKSLPVTPMGKVDYRALERISEECVCSQP